MRITVIVTPEEHAKIKRAAGLVPLSAWMKHVAMCECNGERLEIPNAVTRKAMRESERLGAAKKGKRT